MECANDDTLGRLLDGKLAEADRLALERHFGECARCSAIFAELGAAPAMIVGPYRVVRVVGEGGMGRVYEAVHGELGTRVALKVMLAVDSELSKRFLTEARAASTVRHDRIARVLDFMRTDDDRAVIVMDLVEGKTLRAHEKEGRLSIEFVVRVITDVLEGLAAAHAMGITHRDLKPDNIVVEPNGRAKVLDFGIAKIAHAAPSAVAKTRTGAAIGTPEYMSPEQISVEEAGARSDLYAAGVVLYEALVGERPFVGSNDFEIMRAHLDAPIPHARAKRPDVPPALDAAITRALAKSPDDRFADATEMIRALSSPVVSRSRRWIPALALFAVAASIVGWKLTQREHPVVAVVVPDAAPVVRNAAPVVDAALPDAPIDAMPKHKTIAKKPPVDPNCYCQVDASNERFPKNGLCTTSHRAPMCHCMESVSEALCPTPLEPCPGDCPDFAIDVLDTHTKYTCSIGVPGKWWAADKVQGEPCSGYHRPGEPERAGKWVCSVCGAIDPVPHTPGAACHGFHRSGVEVDGHVFCKPTN